jgi:hypothetical protein
VVEHSGVFPAGESHLAVNGRFPWRLKERNKRISLKSHPMIAISLNQSTRC